MLTVPSKFAACKTRFCILSDNPLEEKLTKQEKSIAKILLKEITSRLTFLKDVGLEYLALDRESSTSKQYQKSDYGKIIFIIF